jgi:GntR family transcriptional regulator, colanic acid and biofilm gene transcriptional regulator
MGPFLNLLYNGPEGWSTPKGPHFHCTVLAALESRDSAAARQAIVQDTISGGAGLLSRLGD